MNLHLLSFLSPSVSVYYFPTEEEDDEDGPTFKEKMIEAGLKSIDIFCIWDCCSCWLKFQEMVAWLVFDPFVELFITLCIVINTLFMALDHHNMDKGIEKILKTGNYVSWILMWVKVVGDQRCFDGDLNEQNDHLWVNIDKIKAHADFIF